MTEAYGLQVGGPADYRVKVGSMLLTLVDPHRGHEVAYNRWYERDHFYAGCMIGPWLFAGGRWVATRDLKDRRWPEGSTGVADPIDAGSYVAIYWVEAGHHEDHFDGWARPQVADLYADGRGFPERTHVHTVLFHHVGAAYRDDDPVPIELALDHGYGGMIAVWWDGRDGRAPAALHDALAAGPLRELLDGSSIEIASSWKPSPGETDEVRSQQPMPLGSSPGGPERLVQLLFVAGDPAEPLAAVRRYTDAVEAAGLADLRLAAPFHATVVGTDRYVDQLW